MSQQITLPHAFEPRDYQEPVFTAFAGPDPVKRGILVWHRRAGKDRTALALLSVMAFRTVGTYWHMLPTNVQARRVIWDAVTRNGKRLIEEVFPAKLIKSKNEAEMSLDLINGSKVWVVGSDNYDRLVGTDPIGVTMSEYALAHPAAWEFIRPILAENGGWALFLSTPRARNHLYSLWNTVSADPDWYKQMLTVDDTKSISKASIEFERRSGMPEEMIQQEFYCSFTAGVVGSYYGELIEKARREGRVTNIPHNPSLPVELWFDLGLDDATAVWAIQWHGAQPCAIRYREWSNVSLINIAREVMAWGYAIREIKWPHDGEQREPTTARTRREIVEDEIGVSIEIIPTRSIADGIAAVRVMLGVMAFDALECELGLFALESYSRKWDDKLKTFRTKPLHDWASHGSDALRTGAQSWNDTGATPHPLSGHDEDILEMQRGRRRVATSFNRIYNLSHKVIRAAAGGPNGGGGWTPGEK